MTPAEIDARIRALPEWIHADNMWIDSDNVIPDEIDRAIFAAGMAAIPREPTQAMNAAGLEIFRHRGGPLAPNTVWRAMYDAAKGEGR